VADDGSASSYEPSVAASAESSDVSSAADITPDSGAVSDQASGMDSSIPNDDPNYFVLPISLILIGLYLFTHLLFTKGILSQQKHRRIWNLLLTAGTAGSGITGILLILFINLGIKTALNPSITFWHAELSILMVIGTLIHIHIYWKPFKNIFRVLFGFKNSKVKYSKKPASIVAVAMMLGMILVSGLYFNLDNNGEDNTDSLNISDNTSYPVTSPTTNPDESQNTSNTDDLDSTYDTTQELPDTSTSSNRRGRNRI